MMTTGRTCSLVGVPVSRLQFLTSIHDINDDDEFSASHIAYNLKKKKKKKKNRIGIQLTRKY